MNTSQIKGELLVLVVVGRLGLDGSATTLRLGATVLIAPSRNGEVARRPPVRTMR